MLCSLFLFRLITLDILYTVYGQSSQWMDTFQRDLCRERWNRMDWQGMLRPCKDNLEFGENKLSESLKTSPKYSHILRMDIRKTGEFSKIAIQSRTTEGRVKTVGGDTWRIFVRGPSFITPFVTDLGNGVYQAAFMIMEPGFYKAEINLENSLCNSYKDPPKNWLKQGNILSVPYKGPLDKVFSNTLTSFNLALTMCRLVTKYPVHLRNKLTRSI